MLSLLLSLVSSVCIYPVPLFRTRLTWCLALDMILLICVAVLSKDRKEKERYRLIDAKVGLNAI